MTPTRRRRLIVISLVVGAVAIAATLTLFALQQNMTYLFSPTEVLEGHPPKDARFRLGGVVEEKSIRRANDSLKVDFVVTDRFQTIPVEYTGILPDLFREGQSVVATGAMQNGHFVATEVLAKHDESYMPPEVADAIAKAKAKNRDSGDGIPDSANP